MKATHVKKFWRGKWWNPLTWTRYGYIVENAVPIGFSMIQTGVDSSFASAPTAPAPKYSKESKLIDRIKCFFFGHTPKMLIEQPERDTGFYREYWDICRGCHKVLKVDQVLKEINLKGLIIDALDSEQEKP